MSMEIKEVKLTQEQRKNLAMQLGDIINTEISIIEPIMKAYSNSSYMFSKLNTIAQDCIQKRLLEFCSKLPYAGINITLIFDKSPIVSGILDSRFYIGTVMSISQHGVEMKDSMIEIHVESTKWEEVGLFRLESEPYGAVMISNAFVAVESDEQDNENCEPDESELSNEDNENTDKSYDKMLSKFAKDKE